MDQAKQKCKTARCPEEALKAFNKGLEIIESKQLTEPVIFVLDDCCEFKWPNSIVYTFANRETIFLIYNGWEFVQGTLDQLDFSQ